MEPERNIKQALSDRYDILSVIGKGGMATVYEAIQRSLGRKVALKVVHQNLVHDEEFVKRFLREASICASLSHPNIITVYDVGSVRSVHFMAMEYLEGESLREIIRRKTALKPDETVRFILPVADALDYIHRRGLFHRDVKSSNIFITKQGRPVLMDFGIVFADDGEALSVAGAILGTPEYMSPEQAEGKVKLDWRTDIFSLGIVMYECLTGQLPFKSDNFFTTMNQVIHEEAPTVTRLSARIPKWLSSIVARCMIKDRTRRIQSGGELVRALQSHDHAGTSGGPREKSNTILMLSIVAAFALVLILFLIYLLPDRHPVRQSGGGGGGGGGFFLTETPVTANPDLPPAETGGPEIQQEENPSPVVTTEEVPVRNPVVEEEERLEHEISRHMNIGDSYLASEDFDKALQQYNAALELDPGSALISGRIQNAMDQRAIFQRRQEEDRIRRLREQQEREERNRRERERQVMERLGIEMVRLSSPAHGAYSIGKSEVTQKLWFDIMGYNNSEFKSDHLPVENITYNEVMEFIRKLNDRTGMKFRLPTDKEWEYAANGGSESYTYLYSGSDILSDVGWYQGNSGNITHPVMRKNANAMGIFDMSGNVSEWCSTVAEGKQVVKGGSWFVLNTSCRVTSKELLARNYRDYTTGFRLCKSEH